VGPCGNRSIITDAAVAACLGFLATSHTVYRKRLGVIIHGIILYLPCAKVIPCPYSVLPPSPMHNLPDDESIVESQINTGVTKP
jgi:hypothetical protein